MTQSERIDRLETAVALLIDECANLAAATGQHHARVRAIRDVLLPSPSAPDVPASESAKAEMTVGNATPGRQHNIGGATQIIQSHEQGKGGQ